MHFTPRLLSWISLAFFTLYLLTFFVDDTLRVHHTLLHRFREFGILIFLIPPIFLSRHLKLMAEESGQPYQPSLWQVVVLPFVAIGGAAVIELVLGATTPSALTTPSVTWTMPVFLLALGARLLWVRHFR